MNPRDIVTVPDADGGTADVPSRLGHFEIVGRLGEGGMGVVFEGRDAVLGRRVALKLLHPSGAQTAHARLLREAQALAKLSHPNVVAVFEVGMAGDDPFIAMELVEGETLQRWMRSPREWREVLDLFIAVGHGLAAGHALGIVHRDFKPSNVLIDKRGVPKLGDFGLVGATASSASESSAARIAVASDTLTTPGSVMGTPAYMAPEQALGERVDARADQFSFAKTLREALGEHVPAALEPILSRALSLEPEDRFPDMDSLLHELARVRRGNRRRWIVAGIAAAIVVTTGVAWGIGRAQTVEDPCPAPRDRVASAWSPSRVVELVSIATGIDPQQGAARIAAAHRLLDPYADRWQAFAVETCRATRVEHTQSDSVFDLRMRCLDRRLAELGGSVALISTAADPDQLESSVSALAALSTVDSCGDTERITRELDLPVEPTARAAAEALASRIQSIELDGRADRLKGLVERSQAVVADARKLGHSGTLAAALTAQIRSDTHAYDTTQSEPLLRELTQVAARAHLDTEEAFAWTALIVVIGSSAGRPDEGLALVPAASAAVLRAGDPALLRATLLLAEAIVLDSGPKVAEGLTRLERARTLLVKNGAEQPGSPLAELFADVWLETASALMNIDDNKGAIAAYNHAIERYRAQFGPDTTNEAITRHNLGIALQQAGKLDEALASFREAARINQMRAAGTARLGSNMVSIASVFSERKQLPEALATYDRAVELLRGKMEDNPNQYAALLVGRAIARKNAGRLREAQADYTEAIAAFENAKAIGTNLPLALYNRGELASLEKRWAEAIADYQRAMVEFEKIEGPRRVGYPALGLGRALVMTERPAEAIAPLERALTLLAKRNPSMRAQSEAWLARALAATGGDRRRVEQLSTTARATFRELAAEGNAGAADELRTFERWLAERR